MIGEAIINGIPGHLARLAVQVDNKRLVIEQALVAALGKVAGMMGGGCTSCGETSLDKHHFAEKCPYDYAPGRLGSWEEDVCVCGGGELIKLLASSTGGDDGDALSLATCKRLETGAKNPGSAAPPAGLRTA